MATIACPSCQKAGVSAPTWSFSQTSVEVPTCSRCLKAGVVSVEVKTSAVHTLGEAWDEMTRPRSKEATKAAMASAHVFSWPVEVVDL